MKKERVFDRTPERELYHDDSQAQTYFEESRKGIVGLFENIFIRKILQQYKKRPSLKILDLGTGPGWIPIRLAKAKPDWQITAIDLSESMLERAQKTAAEEKVAVEWLCQKVGETNFPKESFDLIISHLAMHEFLDLNSVFKEIKSLLKPKARLLAHDLKRPSVIGMPFVQAFAIFYSKEMKKQYKESLLSAYTPKEIKEALKRAGLNGNVKWLGGCMIAIDAVNE